MTTTASPAYDIDALREREFPWAARGDACYLNHASTGPLPERTLKALADFNARRARPWEIDEAMQFGTLARARARCAALVGAQASEIALMGNTSYGLNIAAATLPWNEGDVILTFDGEFPANVYPWMALARRGVRLELVPCAGRLPDEEALLAAMDQPGVRAVSVSWVSFATGYMVDLPRIAAACRERQLWCIVDAIQGLGARTMDASALGIDILACGAQKWLLGPWGTGFAYVREGLARMLEPNPVGWLATRASMDFTRLTQYDATWYDDARRFEMLTLPYQDFAGMNASLDLLTELGHEAVTEHVLALGDEIVSWAEATAGVTLLTPRERARRAGIVAVVPPDAVAASKRLTAAHVIHSLREGAIRLAPHAYTTREEIRRALSIMEGT